MVLTYDVKDIFFVEESSITARKFRHRTTVPAKTFAKLQLKDKDKLRWVVLKDGIVILSKVME